MESSQDSADSVSSLVRITAADVDKDPQLLLHSARPESPLTPFDGQVGAVIGDTGYVVTSPNTELIYAPHIGACTTRMRRDYHFGTDDPLYFPQPFNMTIGHLALIPAPSTHSFHNDALAWYRPRPSDFIPHSSMACSGLGFLAPELISRFETKMNALVSSALDRPTRVKNDHYIREGRAALQRLVERLHVVSTHDECLLLVACLQRQYLELYARIEWLDKYLPRIQAQERTHPVNLDLMGAFTYSPDDLQRLFYAGIPVWFTREVTHIPSLRVDKLVRPIAETANRMLPMCLSDQNVDLADAVPPHRLVWTVSPAIALASSSSSSVSPAASSPSTVQPFVDVLGNGPVIIKSDKKKPSSFLISSDNEPRRAYLISTWVKLRPIFLWILAHPGETSRIALKGSQWRSILDLASGLEYKAGTHTSKTHVEMEHLLQELVSDHRHGVMLDLRNLPASPASWLGQQLSLDKQPPVQVTRQILWELYEVSFQLEMMALDQELLPQSNWGIRQLDLSSCWHGLPFAADLNSGNIGLGSSSFEKRLPFVQALHAVVRAWPGPKPDLILFPFPQRLTDGSVTSAHFEHQVNAVEEALARFYVRTFFNTFARPPTIPHRLE
ncbi:hypothetical protein K435DRAFT_803851 [Dendrothele bispora CBS 962.96]|uniref:Uncharacterized protein n=1 Tax=Dendrothele bispora (strain CBS 962.96) TaxID=1314807 RepID=A0A4S8LGX7_DENBC|nr:hypothetical protein K435DRAFT_803851 [Dendrothele bispora CBS 962.96]